MKVPQTMITAVGVHMQNSCATARLVATITKRTADRPSFSIRLDVEQYVVNADNPATLAELNRRFALELDRAVADAEKILLTILTMAGATPDAIYHTNYHGDTEWVRLTVTRMKAADDFVLDKLLENTNG